MVMIFNLENDFISWTIHGMTRHFNFWIIEPRASLVQNWTLRKLHKFETRIYMILLFFPSKWHLISLKFDLDGFCMTIRSHAYIVVVVSDTGRSYAETSESLASPRHSPRSTLEAISTLSPPHSNQRTYCSGSPSSSTSGMHLSPRNSFPHRWK